MAKMITLFGKDIKELSFNELKREKRCQSVLLTRMKNALKEEQEAYDNHPSRIRADKVAFYETYKAHLETLLQEIDFWLDRRQEPTSNHNWTRPVWQIRKDNKKRLARLRRDTSYAIDWEKNGDGLAVSWDRDKFMQIAYDRGYQTEDAVVSEVSEELKFTRSKAKTLLDKGRFAWGHVLCLGAMLQMTPKEFCDTFLAGYFVDEFGEYRASYEHLNKVELLKRTMKNDPLFGIKEEVIEIGSDGRPLDEEEWF